eukprot:9007437-Pyramimonas_sp.AAC.1
MASAAKLQLNLKECQIALCRGTDRARLLTALATYGAPFDQFQVVSSALYIGFPLGPGGSLQRSSNGPP